AAWWGARGSDRAGVPRDDPQLRGAARAGPGALLLGRTLSSVLWILNDCRCISAITVQDPEGMGVWLEVRAARADRCRRPSSRWRHQPRTAARTPNWSPLRACP